MILDVTASPELFGQKQNRFVELDGDRLVLRKLRLLQDREGSEVVEWQSLWDTRKLETGLALDIDTSWKAQSGCLSLCLHNRFSTHALMHKCASLLKHQ